MGQMRQPHTREARVIVNYFIAEMSSPYGLKVDGS